MFVRNVNKTKRILLLFFSLLLVLFSLGCSNQNTMENTTDTSETASSYRQITPEDAKEMMDSGEDIVLLDVRTEEEYQEGHIPGAVLLPDDEVAEKAETVLTDKEQTILVYCRSGRRSAAAAKILLELGYENIYDLGGIIDWPYEIETKPPAKPVVCTAPSRR